jgi:hypothetical protein
MSNHRGDWAAQIEQLLICGAASEQNDVADENIEEFFDFKVDAGTSELVVDLESDNQSQSHYDLHRAAVSLLQQFQHASLKRNIQIHPKIQALQMKISELKREANRDHLLRQIHHYLQRQHKLQLLTLASSMQKLDSCHNILEIPDLILGVKQSMPQVIVDGTKIKTMVDRVVSNTRSHLLKKFHCFFEEQLNEESLSNVSDPASTGKRSMWEVFLRRSRDWLLAYSLVSILPASLTAQAQQAVLEKFQDAWDEALTPIWGRFYHHLRMTRESKSTNQIVWTFNYAKSFIEMLVNLCRQITQAEQMQQLCAEVDYSKAGTQQIVDKSLKFLKAHVAQVFVDIECNQSFLMELVEEIIDFDSWLCHGLDLGEARTLGWRGLATIIYESKDVFHNWITIEQSLICEQLASVTIAPLAKPFSVHFSRSCIDKSANVHSNEQHINCALDPSFMCYSSIYTIISLFVNARVRYSYFPPSAQWILSELILEPLLCAALGLLLYKIRCTPDLYHISTGDMKWTGLRNSSEWLAFRNTVSYFQSSIGEIPTSQLGTHFVADSRRCKKRWTIVQNWIPKILITEQQEKHGFDLDHLMKTSLKVSEKFRNNTLEYRNDWISAQSAVDSIADCIIMTRGLAITLVDVLEKQFAPI